MSTPNPHYRGYRFPPEIISYKVAIRGDGDEFTLPTERLSLLELYERLQQRRLRRVHSDFYELAHDGLIAGSATKMLIEEIRLEGGSNSNNEDEG